MEYKRIKLGISNNKNIDTKDYVLGKFSSDEKRIVNEVIEKASTATLECIGHPFNEIMSKYNIKIKN